MRFCCRSLCHINCVIANVMSTEYDNKNAVQGYDESLAALSYTSPGYISNMLAGLIVDIENAKVLDLAAGTGWIGQGLYKRGFRNLDAHDGAQAMVDYCKKTGIYKDFFTCFIGDGHSLPMKDNTYDAVTCSGATVENHLPPCSQGEILRVIKPGGFFVNGYRGNLSETEVEYAKEWHAEAERLEKEGKWTLYGRLHFRKYLTISGGTIDITRLIRLACDEDLDNLSSLQPAIRAHGQQNTIANKLSHSRAPPQLVIAPF
ncbi:Williams-Beuren syndrome chromosomal region 27 protein-like [Plakobranchus ocellatus]|uniref:Williams-Beuren syndrome chromosomal region 27 protein-like n=1 Tax=Plakobranchus ocellatus TaxID=259542 RepID=A0AAV4BDF5_9GAST|nr:Williams-Beuren syndrome chromosomal region 27 protein-like [Plakobranchus ocellatus]